VSCEQARPALGTYVLAALDLDEHRDVAGHIAECARCQAELVELEGLPGLLDRVPISDVVSEVRLAELALPRRHVGPPTPDRPVVQPSPRLFDRLLDPLLDPLRDDVLHDSRSPAGCGPVAEQPPAHTGRPRGRVLAIAAGLALVIAAVAAAADLSAGPQTRPPSAASTPAFTTTDPTSKVTVTAWVIPRPSGTAVSLRLAGATPGERCWLVAVGRDGQQETVVDWQVASRGDATISGVTAIKRSELATLRVVRDDHRTLAELPIS
jgi:hypothetical protein